MTSREELLSQSALDPAKGTEILRVEVGSTLHGTGLPGGEDLDLMAVAIPQDRWLIGLDDDWGTYVRRTQPDGVRSGPDDIDYTCYSLRKFIKLSMAGNPSMLLPYYAPDSHVHHITPAGEALRSSLRKLIPSKLAGARFLGYLQGQKQRFLGEKARHGRIRRNPDGSPDFKYAMHMVRLGYQGIEYMQTGELELPMVGERAEICRSIRRGEHEVANVLDLVGAIEGDLKKAIDDSLLPEKPNKALIERWCMETHYVHWSYGLLPKGPKGHGW